MAWTMLTFDIAGVEGEDMNPYYKAAGDAARDRLLESQGSLSSYTVDYPNTTYAGYIQGNLKAVIEDVVDAVLYLARQYGTDVFVSRALCINIEGVGYFRGSVQKQGVYYYMYEDGRLLHIPPRGY